MALIIRMSHCRPASGSCPAWSPCAVSAAVAVAVVATAISRAGFGSACGAAQPMTRLRAAPARVGCVATASSKRALLVRTVASPTQRFSSTIAPPAALMAARAAAAGTPFAYRTR